MAGDESVAFLSAGARRPVPECARGLAEAKHTVQLYYGEEAAQGSFAAGICAKFAIKSIDGHLRR